MRYNTTLLSTFQTCPRSDSKDRVRVNGNICYRTFWYFVECCFLRPEVPIVKQQLIRSIISSLRFSAHLVVQLLHRQILLTEPSIFPPSARVLALCSSNTRLASQDHRPLR